MHNHPTGSGFLLHTKLEIPSLGGRIVRRKRLTSLFDKPVERKVILLTAPAGYGKTTLIGEWLALTSAADHRTAWVSLDPHDNAPGCFWAYLVAAVKRAWPSIRLGEPGLPAHDNNAPDFMRLIPLLNEIGGLPGYLNLILDDYQAITDPLIHESVEYLLQHQPKNLLLVFSSRVKTPFPLARLRTFGRLVEIGAQDLCFSFEETRQYLAESLQKPLRPDEILATFEKTEGWITGLKLAVINHEISRPANGFSVQTDERNRRIPDYFWEEVWKPLPPVMQNFLLKTSFLSEFSAALCDHLLNIDNSSQIIAEFEARTLFITRIEPQGAWYRWHPLLACSLEQQLKKQQPSISDELHRTALEWLVQNNMPDKAVGYALYTGQEQLAAGIIETTAMKAIIRFDLDKLIQWINAISDTLAATKPRLRLIKALAHFLLGQYGTSARDLAKTEQYLASLAPGLYTLEEQTACQWQISAIGAAIEAIQGDYSKGLADGKRLLQQKNYENDYIFAMVTFAMAIANERKGSLDEAARFFDASRKYGLKNDHIYGFFHSNSALARVLVRQGRLNEARRELEKALEYAVELNLEMATISLALTGLLEIALEQNDLTRADELAAKTLIHFDKTIVSQSVWINHIERCVALSNYFVRKNDPANARLYLERAMAAHDDYSPAGTALPDNILRACIRVLAAEARENKVSSWYEKAGGAIDPSSRETTAGRMVQARIYMNQGNPFAARDLMEILVKEIKQTEDQDLLLHALVLYALALYACGDKGASLVILEDALQMGSVSGYVRAFTEEGQTMKTLLQEYRLSPMFAGFEQRNPHYTARILNHIEEDRRQEDGQDLGELPVITSLHLLQEPLSEREMDVLKLLNSEKTTKEIAESLMISVNTAKTHVMNIYRKFDVHSRRMLLDRIKEHA